MGASFATSTFDLVERFRNGDQFAFSQLFSKYKPRLAVLIRYKLSESTRERLEVDDVLQQVFLDASKDIAGFTYRSPGSFMSWLSRIADHVIVDEVRAHARHKRNAAEIVPFRSASNPGGPEPVDTATPSRILVQREAADKLLARLDTLPPDYREAILLAKFEGLSSTEMAERMGRSREAAAVLLCRALRCFRKLSENDDERRKTT